MMDFKSNSLEEWRRLQVDGEVRETGKSAKIVRREERFMN